MRIVARLKNRNLAEVSGPRLVFQALRLSTARVPRYHPETTWLPKDSEHFVLEGLLVLTTFLFHCTQRRYLGRNPR